MTPHDALLLVSFGGPEGPEDVLPVPGERHAWPGDPARAAAGGRRPLRPLRRREPDQRPEPSAPSCRGGGPRGPRGRPARLLGEPQLGALARRGGRRDGRRRHQARAVLRHVGVLVVLGLPAVPREPRGRRGPRGRRRTAPGEAPHVLRPPGVRRALRRLDRHRPRGAPRGRPPRGAAGLHDALDPGGGRRHQWAGWWRLRGAAPRRRPAGRRGRRQPHGRRGPALGPRLPVEVRAPDATLARAGRRRPPGGPGGRTGRAAP